MAERKPERKFKKLKKPDFAKVLQSKAFKVSLAVLLFFFIGSSAAFLYYYNFFSRMIDRRLNGEVFKNTAQIYAAPFRVYPGQKLTLDDAVRRLQRAGFEPADKGPSNDGTYEIADGNKIIVRPKVGDVMQLNFGKNSLTRIIKPGDDMEAWLPAELVTNLFDDEREKRRLAEYKDLPPALINALLASEDQRFFSHWGIDPIRLIGAVAESGGDIDRVRGTSTITQQLARNFFLTLDRSPTRKVQEIFVSFLLEQRLSKEQILTMYANEVSLGHRGSFGINGFGEGAARYFGKDLSALTLPEAAMLVAILPAPNGKFSPTKYPEDVKKRRNQVLDQMHSLGKITDKEWEAAKNTDLKLAPVTVDATDAPYLVDYIRDELLKDFSEEEITNNSLRVYTSLDPELQKIAVDAVASGLKFANEQLAALRKRSKKTDNLPGPQASLIVLDPRTGEIKAMVGGSDYGASQFNRIIRAARQPGSIFKPIVYAAAFETAFDGLEPAESSEPAPSAAEGAVAADPEPRFESFRRDGVITPITTLVDEPTVFANEGSAPYEPNNYKQQYRGLVTVRQALQHSLNIPTIKVAERIGYDRVAAFAKRLGLNAKIKGYPSVALGAFEVTPIEMAGAYTAFANEGRYSQPHAIIRVTSPGGLTNKTYKHEPKEVMRPELAYLMTHLMENVINAGTGQRVRGMGFRLPAAGKTGTSRDGWFAGYTKDFLAIAWVGYDDNRDLNLEGSRSALPIWTEFMLKATQLYPPRDPDKTYFGAPSGIEFSTIDAESMLPSNASCIDTFEEAFIAGTVPGAHCPLHGFTLSEAVQEGVTETGRGIGKAFQGVGRFIGGIFGGGDKDKETKTPQQ